MRLCSSPFNLQSGNLLLYAPDLSSLLKDFQFNGECTGFSRSELRDSAVMSFETLEVWIVDPGFQSGDVACSSGLGALPLRKPGELVQVETHAQAQVPGLIRQQNCCPAGTISQQLEEVNLFGVSRSRTEVTRPV